MTEPAKQLRVLVVDDDASIRLLVKRALEKHGFFELDVAADGVEALRKLEEEHFDLLILDLMMPRLNGFDVVERLSRTGAEMPKILVMTAASPSVLRDLPVHRVEKIITKPFEIQTLISSALDVAGEKTDENAC